VVDGVDVGTVAAAIWGGVRGVLGHSYETIEGAKV